MDKIIRVLRHVKSIMKLASKNGGTYNTSYCFLSMVNKIPCDFFCSQYSATASEEKTIHPHATGLTHTVACSKCPLRQANTFPILEII